MKNYKIYTDMDSLFDVRYAILSKLLEPKKLKFEDVFLDTYNKRIIDIFERKDLGINKRSFEYEFNHRDFSLIAKYGKPSKVINQLLKIAVDANQVAGIPLSISGVELTINYYPYELDDEIKEYISGVIKESAKYIESVDLVSIPFHEITGKTLRPFTHAVVYYLLSGGDYNKFQLSLGNEPVPGLKCIVPALYCRLDEDTPGSDPEQSLLISGIMSSQVISVVPTSPGLFDAVPYIGGTKKTE